MSIILDYFNIEMLAPIINTELLTLAPSISKTLKYDIKLTDPNGNESYYMKGNLNVSEGYTA